MPNDYVPKFDDTEELPPKFDDTLDAETSPMEFEPGVTSSQRKEPKREEDTLPRSAVTALSKKYGVPQETLEKQMIRLGATYPNAPWYEKTPAKVYSFFDNLLANAPSWVAKKWQDDDGEKAFDELKAEIEKNKSLPQSALEFTSSMATPVGNVGKLMKGGKYAKTAAQGATMGGAFGLTGSESGNEIQDTLEGAAFGGTAAPLMQRGLEGTASSISRLLGKNPERVQKYLNDPKRYNRKDLTFENVQRKIDEPLTKLQDDLLNAKDAEAMSRDAYKMARLEKMQALRDTRPGDDVNDLVKEMLKGQRARASEGAQKQVEALENAGRKIDLKGIMQDLADGIKARKVEGVSLPGDKAAQVMSEQKNMLNEFSKRFLKQFAKKNKLTPEIKANPQAYAAFKERAARELARGLKADPKSMMRIRQQIDENIKSAYDKAEGAYNNQGEKLAKSVRNKINERLDTELPNSKEYQKIRRQLAADTELAERGSKAFGKEDPTSTIAGLANPNNKQKLELLRYLDKQNTGGKISERLRPYLEAQRALKNKPALERTMRELPEASQSKKAKELLEALKAKKDSYGSITPKTSQNAIRDILFATEKKPAVRTKEAIDALGKDSQQNLLQEIDDLGVRSEFIGGSPNGSRLVNMGRSAGRPFGPVGEIIGGVTGGLVDYTTGRAAKLALDTALKAKDPAVRAMAVKASDVVNAIIGKSGSNPDAEKYAKVMDKASEGGPQAIMARHAVLMKDPAYRAIFEETDGQDTGKN